MYDKKTIWSEYIDFLTKTHLHMDVRIIPHGILYYESFLLKRIKPPTSSDQIT